MKENKIYKIIELAKEQGICQEWYERMKNEPTLENLCQMFFDGDDWAMKNNFPNLSILKEFKGISNQYGIYFDEKGVLKEREQMAFFGSSDISVKYDEFSVAQLTLRHQSKAKIKASGNARLFINVLDETDVEIECIDNAKVSVFWYGGKVAYKGNVVVIKSELK